MYFCGQLFDFKSNFFQIGPVFHTCSAIFKIILLQIGELKNLILLLLFFFFLPINVGFEYLFCCRK